MGIKNDKCFLIAMIIGTIISLSGQTVEVKIGNKTYNAVIQ